METSAIDIAERAALNTGDLTWDMTETATDSFIGASDKVIADNALFEA